MEQIMELIKKSQESGTTGYSLEAILIQFAATLCIGCFIYVVYRLTYSGVAYSKNFNLSILITTLVTAMVMMVIGTNLALSLGMVGALSIVRFRAAIKEPKDIGFLFWGIAVGLSAGTGSFVIAVVGSLLIGAVLLVAKFGTTSDLHYLIILRGEVLDEKAITEQLKPLVKRFRLKTRQIQQGSAEMIFEVNLIKGKESIMDRVSVLPGVSMANLVAYNGEIS